MRHLLNTPQRLRLALIIRLLDLHRDPAAENLKATTTGESTRPSDSETGVELAEHGFVH